MSQASEWNKFWSSQIGVDILQTIESSCISEGNDELVSYLQSTIFQRDLKSVEEVQQFLLGCQKSIQRVISSL